MKLTYANVMSTVAVFIALGGTSYAVVRLPRNSVGTVQLKANAVNASKVRDGSIGRAELSASARGTRGPRGGIGPPGAAGPTGAGDIIVRRRDELQARPELAAGSYVNVISFALPAGRWLVIATTEVANDGAAVTEVFRCFVVVDGVRRGLGKVAAAGNGTSGTTAVDLTLLEVVEQPAPTTIILSCGHDNQLPPDSQPRFDRAKIVAIPVASADVKDVTG